MSEERVLQCEDLPQNRPRTSAPSLIHFKASHNKNMNFTFMWPCCIVTNFFIIKPTDALMFPSLFLSRNSTCFGQFLWLPSGVYHCTFGTGICHASLITDASAECTVENSWRWAEELPETFSFLTKINLEKISASVGFIKNKNINVTAQKRAGHSTPWHRQTAEPLERVQARSLLATQNKLLLTPRCFRPPGRKSTDIQLATQSLHQRINKTGNVRIT
jgi:hypothetical protein